MRTIFFTSDTHFGHGGALGLYRRPFASVAAMDEALIERWNEAVGADDEIRHLGDFAIRQPASAAAELLTRLHGTKHLVTGNNDPPATTGQPSWASVQPYAETTVDGVSLVLCHYPFRSWHGMGKGWDRPARAQSRPAEAGAAAIRCRRRRLGLSPRHRGRDFGEPLAPSRD